MQRRTFLVIGGGISAATFAGCLGSSNQPNIELNLSLPEDIDIYDVTAEVGDSEPLGRVLLVSGTIENIGSTTRNVPYISATYYDADDVKLGDGSNLYDGVDSVGPGEKVKFEIYYDRNPDDVTRIVLTNGSGASASEAAVTDTPEPTPESTPEPVSELFTDGWNDGQYTSEPKWSVRTSGRGSYVEVVNEPSPVGENSLSLVGNSGNSALAYTHQDLAFDSEWVAEMVFKPVSISQDNRFRLLLDASFDGMVNNIGVTVNIGFREGPGDTQLITPHITGDHIKNSEPGIVIDWEEGSWYRLSCHHDGEGVYRLKVWDAVEQEPEEYMTQSVGDVPSSERRKLGISQYVARGDDMRTNIAEVSHTTNP